MALGATTRSSLRSPTPVKSCASSFADSGRYAAEQLGLPGHDRVAQEPENLGRLDAARDRPLSRPISRRQWVAVEDRVQDVHQRADRRSRSSSKRDASSSACWRTTPINRSSSVCSMSCIADAATIEVGVWVLRSPATPHATEHKARERSPTPARSPIRCRRRSPETVRPAEPWHKRLNCAATSLI